MPAEAGTALWGVLGGLLMFWLGSGAIQWYSARRSTKAQVSGDEREARRDTVADRDKLLEFYAARIPVLEERVQTMWDERAQDHARIRAMGDHIDVLQRHIWDGKPPPPPPAPIAY